LVKKLRELVSALAQSSVNDPNLHLHLGQAAASGKWAGCEAAFSRPFVEGVKARGIPFQKEVTLESVGASSAWASRSEGRVDIVLDWAGDRYGVELKVLRLPRTSSNSPMQCMYDLAQIWSDYTRVHDATKLAGGYCLLLLHGTLVSTAGTARQVRRIAHNSLFVDYETARRYGRLLDEHETNWAREQVKQMGFGHPYAENLVRAEDFCVISENRSVAALGIWAGKTS